MDEHVAQVRVERKEQIADDVVSVVLHEVSGVLLPAWAPGAHVDLVIEGVATRQFSLCGDPTDRSTYRLGVLREAEGEGGSRYIHDVLLEGDEATVQGPRNHFRFVPAPRYIFLAGGIGITPLLPMIAAADAAGADWRLVYGGRRRSSMAFLDDVLAYGDRVAIRPREETGRMDLGVVLGTPHEDTLVYACGPESLLEDIEQRMLEWPRAALHVERFSARPLAEPERAGAFEIVLRQSGRRLIVPPDRSILSIVEEAGVPVLSSCAHGTCGTCETAVIDGVPDHRDSVLNEEERASNEMMMICISRATSDRLVLDL